jgi:hypothetical protein
LEEEASFPHSNLALVAFHSLGTSSFLLMVAVEMIHSSFTVLHS